MDACAGDLLERRLHIFIARLHGFLHLLCQLSAGLEQTGLHRTQATTRDGSNLFIGQILILTKNDHLPVLGSQGLKKAGNKPDLFRLLHFGERCIRSMRQFLCIRQGHVTPGPAQGVETLITCNREKPGLEG